MGCLIAVLAAAAAGSTCAETVASAADDAPAEVRFSVGSDAFDRRFDFAAELLSAALAADGYAARVVPVSGMTQRRSMQVAREGRLDVLVLPNTSTDLHDLIAVRMPISRGLLGVRLLLSRPEDADRIARVKTLEELKTQFVLGYGHDWLDYEQMRDIGFRIETANGYRNLFDMLRGGRFDYLSRGINEIGRERADPALAGTGMVVVPGIALFYPLDGYFVVPNRNASLAARIEHGMSVLLADGRYDRMLDAHFGDEMRDAQLDRRSIIHVRDYPVPEGTPLEKFDVLQPERSRSIFHGTDGQRRRG